MVAILGAWSGHTAEHESACYIWGDWPEGDPCFCSGVQPGSSLRRPLPSSMLLARQCHAVVKLRCSITNVTERMLTWYADYSQDLTSAGQQIEQSPSGFPRSIASIRQVAVSSFSIAAQSDNPNSSIFEEVMDITNMLNKKGGVAIHQQFPGGFPIQPNTHYSLIKPDPSLERSVSPHVSEQSPYSTSHNMSRAFGSPAGMQASMHLQNPMSNAMHMPNFPDMQGMGNMTGMSMQQMTQQSPQSQQQIKAYACSSCGKGFARRSDLARHERIHSGHRPHVCEYPNCGKMFIQRSALTVHHRVHTGEKPHHCETCAKPFSDSSSLARHRRTHSGKRPYKCPYADCQKTFTRRTTLTRHQNHHSGTIEEAAAATAAALAASKTKNGHQARSDGDHMSSHGSPMTTPSPAQRTMSMSPSMDLSVTNGMNRHASEFHYLQQSGPLPPHLRVGSPTATTSAGYSGAIRPTSHPTGYGPPNTLEPNLEQHQTNGAGSAGGSPHMSSVGWPSPSHLPSPSHNGAGYVYPEPDGYPPNPASMGQMYYGAATQMRRPQSTEPGLVHMA